MSLYCSVDADGDYDWYWEPDSKGQQPLSTKRSRRCCSCKSKIKVGETALKLFIWRPPENDIEERIHGDEVYLAPKYFCETCADLSDSLNELGFCYDINQSLAQQIKDYRDDERSWNERYNKHLPETNTPSGS